MVRPRTSPLIVDVPTMHFVPQVQSPTASIVVEPEPMHKLSIGNL